MSSANAFSFFKSKILPFSKKLIVKVPMKQSFRTIVWPKIYVDAVRNYMHSLYLKMKDIVAEPHSSVGSVADLRTGSPARPIFFSGIDDSHCDRIHSSLTTVHCFDDGYVGKQPMAWKNTVQSTG